MRLLLRPFKLLLLDGPAALLELCIRHHNLFFVTAALVAAAVLAGVTGHWLFYRGAYVIGGLIVLCFFWARSHARGLEVQVQRTEERLQVGQETETRLRLQSQSQFTKLWLEIQDQTTMPGRPAKTVITLGAKGVRNWKINARCLRRGVYSAGPVRIRTGDPFGLFKFNRFYGDRQRVLVLPQPQELPYFWAPAAQLPGEGVVRKRTHYVTPNASGIREYYPGDSYNRIHWRSTARLGRLMVKTFEMDPTSNIWVVLDLHGAVQAGEGDESTEEYAVRISASLAHHFMQGNRMLGLMMSGAEKVLMDPARGAQQYNRVLEALAVADASGDQSLAALLEEEGRRLGRHTTMIIITSSRDPDWVLSLGALLQQGARAAVVFLDSQTFVQTDARPGGAGDARESPADALAASGVVTYVVRAHSDISLMLGPAGVVGGHALERTKVGAR